VPFWCCWKDLDEQDLMEFIIQKYQLITVHALELNEKTRGTQSVRGVL